LTTGSYGIITSLDNTVTAVISRRHILIIFLERLDRQRQHVADAALGLDHARCTRVDLQIAPQPKDLDIDAPVEDIFVNSRRLQQMLARERPLRCFEKGEQQGLLTFAQWDRRLVAVYESSAATFKPPATESVSATLRIMSACSSPHFPVAAIRHGCVQAIL
jgi:hypothetical protein